MRAQCVAALVAVVVALLCPTRGSALTVTAAGTPVCDDLETFDEAMKAIAAQDDAWARSLKGCRLFKAGERVGIIEEYPGTASLHVVKVRVLSASGESEIGYTLSIGLKDDVATAPSHSGPSLPCDQIVRTMQAKEPVMDASSKPGFGEGSASMKHLQADLILFGKCADDDGRWMQTIWNRANPPRTFVATTGRVASLTLALPAAVVERASFACLKKARADHTGEQTFTGGELYCETDRAGDHGVLLQVTRHLTKQP